MSMVLQPIRFSTDDGVSLEGELRTPPDELLGTAVVCHADPRRGGSKDHPIVWAVRNDLAARGFVVLAFNFRGTMGSGGTYGGGAAEVADVRAAIGRVREEAEGPTLVAGWSFGAAVALREAATDDRVGALALIGFPLRNAIHRNTRFRVPRPPAGADLSRVRRPVLFLSGEQDELCPPDDLAAFASTMPRAQVEILHGTDHFLWRHEKDAAERVGAFAERVLAG